MSLEQWSYLAQIIAAVAVVFSLIFIGLQIKQNTAALQRNEHNSTMAQWTVMRMAIVQHRDVAELVTGGLRGERTLDAADQLRLDQLLQEYAWAAFHIWDRTQRGVFPRGTFEMTAGAFLGELLGTPRGRACGRRRRAWGSFPPTLPPSTLFWRRPIRICAAQPRHQHDRSRSNPNPSWPGSAKARVARESVSRPSIDTMPA